MSIVAKEIDSDTDRFIEIVRKAALDRAYDLSVIIPEDYVRAEIMLNRDKGISAAVCSTAEDMQAAEANNANVIVIKSAETGGAARMLSGILSRSGAKDPEQKQAKVQERQVQQQKKSEQPKPSRPMVQEKAYEGKGMLKKLKYSLGIEDE